MSETFVLVQPQRCAPLSGLLLEQGDMLGAWQFQTDPDYTSRKKLRVAGLKLNRFSFRMDADVGIAARPLRLYAC